MRSLGITYTSSAIGFPRVHVECDYRLAMVYDDLILIEVCLTKLGRSSARLEFRALKEGEVAAQGVIVIACMDRKTQRAIPFPDDLRDKLTPAVQAQ
jgi:acyl-CoA thioesterase FadM